MRYRKPDLRDMSGANSASGVCTSGTGALLEAACTNGIAPDGTYCLPGNTDEYACGVGTGVTLFCGGGAAPASDTCGSGSSAAAFP
jgi:hypothetical protein